ncbi:hypothetical protein ACA910_006674 [Epithemia clementina (nom. ined.)]
MLSDIIEANNHGVLLLSDGRFGEAERIFRVALRGLQRLIAQPMEAADMISIATTMRLSINPVSVHQRTRTRTITTRASRSTEKRYRTQAFVPGILEHEDDDQETSPVDHNTFYFYQKAMQILPPLHHHGLPLGEGFPLNSIHPARIEKQHRYLSAIVLYNLGIVHHMRGRFDTRRRKASYETSMKMYGSATQLLRGGGGAAPSGVDHFWFAASTNSCETDEVRLLRLAIFNNMAHLNFHSFNVKQSQVCLAMMQSILERVTEYQRDHEDFHMNLCLSADQEHRIAPAA